MEIPEEKESNYLVVLLEIVLLDKSYQRVFSFYLQENLCFIFFHLFFTLLFSSHNKDLKSN